ncbi:hypothetical protein BGAL_0065g00370 [Botrytis galanthina]|uniref:Uncharacterized protein n=1 Tax=Botrytis galanthina TaxID=278940 RepID=A0A4S8R4V7_9HELO|nr:hypothetical protein BGAL_0065g00370 [Botrytis galanthina]
MTSQRNSWSLLTAPKRKKQKPGEIANETLFLTIQMKQQKMEIAIRFSSHLENQSTYSSSLSLSEY